MSARAPRRCELARPGHADRPLTLDYGQMMDGGSVMSWSAAVSGVVATTVIGSLVIHSLARASLG